MTTPSTTDVAAISAIDDVWKWAGVAQESIALFTTAAGEVRLIRELAMMSKPDFEAIVASLRTAATHPITVMEAGRFQLAMNCAMVCMGMDPDKPAAAAASAAPPSGNPGTALVPYKPTTGIKFNKVLDQSNDTEVVKLESRIIRQHLANYKLRRGDLPHPDHAPSSDQISAMQQLLDQDAVPYCDFAIFGPHGSRAAKKLSHTGFLQQPDGQWIRQELAGPGDFDQWWRCYRVFKTLMVMLNTIDVEHVDNYAEHVRGLYSLFGQRAWWIVYQGDIRMRSEYMDRLRTDLEARHEQYANISADLVKLSDHDNARPWNAVWKHAINERSSEFWKQEVETKAMMYLNALQTSDKVADDGTALQHPVEKPLASMGSSPRRPPPPPARQASPQAAGYPPKSMSYDKFEKKRKASVEGHPKFENGLYTTNGSGNEICRSYNSGECQTSPCSRGFQHQCSKCLQQGHTAQACTAPRPVGTPGKGGGKGAGSYGRGKGGRKGK